MRSRLAPHSYPESMDHRAVTPALDLRAAAALSDAIRGTIGNDIELRIDDRDVALTASTRTAIVELLKQLSTGRSVVVGTLDELLTTSQAAELLGVSDTYVRRLADAGTLPIEMRGSHRRFRVEQLLRYRDRIEP